MCSIFSRGTLAVAFLIIVGVLAGISYAQSTDARPSDSVIVYYFHTNFRCTNCHNMEMWTKELMETRFKDRVAGGQVALKVFNTDEKANQHFLNDYKLYTKSVVVSLVKGGKEVRYENLAKIWDYLRSKEKFQKYVGDEIEKYIKEL